MYSESDVDVGFSAPRYYTVRFDTFSPPKALGESGLGWTGPHTADVAAWTAADAVTQQRVVLESAHYPGNWKILSVAPRVD